MCGMCDEDNGSEITLICYVFEAAEAMTIQYEELVEAERDVELQSEVVVIQVNETHILDIELFRVGDGELLVPFAEEAIVFVEYGIIFYDEFGVSVESSEAEESDG